MADFDTVNRRTGNKSGSQLGLVFAAIVFLSCALLFGGATVGALAQSATNASHSSLFID